jgi:hypothetical protein
MTAQSRLPMMGLKLITALAWLFDVACVATSGTLLVITLVGLADRWPSYSWLDVVISLLIALMIAACIAAGWMATQDGEASGSWQVARRVSLYIVIPALGSVLISTIAFVMVFILLLSR